MNLSANPKCDRSTVIKQLQKNIAAVNRIEQTAHIKQTQADKVAEQRNHLELQIKMFAEQESSQIKPMLKHLNVAVEAQQIDDSISGEGFIQTRKGSA